MLFCHAQVDIFGPSLRSLTLVMKALLKQARLNDRATGGVGSYCLLNLVMAHLQAEGVQAGTPANMGQLLLSLLLRFGKDFDYAHKAVSVREVRLAPKHCCVCYFRINLSYHIKAIALWLQGGFMTKLKAWRQKKNLDLLAVEDPQQPGRDIGAGAFNILQVPTPVRGVKWDEIKRHFYVIPCTRRHLSALLAGEALPGRCV